MGNLVLKGGDILTLDENDSLLTHNVVIIDQDTGYITDIKPESEYNQGDHDTMFDCTDKVIMPGLVDLHFHTAFCRGWDDFRPLKEFLEVCWYPSLRGLDDESAYWVALGSYLEAIKSGTTNVNDMYCWIDSLAKAAKEIGIRATLANDVALPQYNIDTLDDARTCIKKYNNTANGRIKVRVGVEWMPLGNMEMLLEARQIADEYHTGIHIHLNESPVEVQIVKDKNNGKSPATMAYEAGVLGPDCIAAHCVHLSDLEIKRMGETHTFMSHNPVSNAKLGNGIAKVRDWIKNGVIVGLGHDAAECNNSEDMFETMKFTSLIHRAKFQDPTLFQAKDILKMCCINGNKALSYSKYEAPMQIGMLKKGYKADIITLDANSQKFIPVTRGEDVSHYYSNIVFSCNGSVVKDSIIDGRVVMKDRVMVTVNEAKIASKFNYYFNKIKKTIIESNKKNGL